MKFLHSVALPVTMAGMMLGTASLGWGQQTSGQTNGQTNGTAYGQGTGQGSSGQTTGQGTGQSTGTRGGVSSQATSLSGADDTVTVPGSLRRTEDETDSIRNGERQKKLVEDTEKLLTLANQLKADVDKSSKDMLSLDVIRKADEIEKLAHSVKEKMKGT